ncbi:uncharacterized protein LOC143048853 [Mytilus galloprovincialis]|uniref:uncharacterized protein LOC143048853 n=1 Tax=Mytilus galloprovincialis TaxID=29158 RepID=UPI003F7BC14E
MGDTEMSDFDLGDPFLCLQALFVTEIELEEVPAPMPSVEVLASTEIVSTEVQRPDPKPQKRFKRVSDEEIIAFLLLRYRVWYNLAMHFVSRGIEFHQQLNLASFTFQKNENDRKYVTLSHETRQKNWQGGLRNSEASADKWMINEYQKAPGLKTDPKAESLFNHCDKDANISPDEQNIWFLMKSVKQYQFSRFMGDISRNAGCSRLYTAHCFRATAIQAMNDAGFEPRHIMYMSGHKNESSVRSYNRGCSVLQKESLSETLSSISSGYDVSAQKSTPAPVLTVSTAENASVTSNVTSVPSPLQTSSENAQVNNRTFQCLSHQTTSCHQDLFPTRHLIIV